MLRCLYISLIAIVRPKDIKISWVHAPTNPKLIQYRPRQLKLVHFRRDKTSRLEHFRRNNGKWVKVDETSLIQGNVNCGSHQAHSCAACPQGRVGDKSAWCLGDCEWDKFNNRCRFKYVGVVGRGVMGETRTKSAMQKTSSSSGEQKLDRAKKILAKQKTALSVGEGRSVKAKTLLSMYKELGPPTKRVLLNTPVPHAYRRQQLRLPSNDITLATQLSPDKLHLLPELSRRWGQGPVSAAVYLTDKEDILKLDSFVRNQSTEFRHWVTLHALLERPGPDVDYPHNLLRNLALQYVETEYFVLLDVDFMPSQDAHNYLYDFLSRKARDVPGGNYNTLYVLPAFDLFGNQKKTEGAPGFIPRNKEKLLKLEKEKKGAPGFNDIPRNKQDLLKLVGDGRAQIFHEYHRRGHGATNYTKWYGCGYGEYSHYPIEYEFQYEPYFMGHTRGLSYFDDRFRGFGMNKVAWVQELDLRGYKFRVLCDAFVAHVWHPGPPTENSIQQPSTTKYSIPMLPNLLLAGTQKAGTTAVDNYMREQGMVCSAQRKRDLNGFQHTSAKEPHFFDISEHFSMGIDFYMDLYSHCNFERDHKYLIDSTPNYQLFPERIHKAYKKKDPAALDNLKIIFTLREPVAREMSWFNHW